MSPRLALRAVIVEDGRLLMVNAWKDGDLWCAPGGGAEMHQSLPENLAREVWEECGLKIAVGQTCLLNEYHEEARGFHQVELFFHCRILGGDRNGAWTDPEGIVTERRWVTKTELATMRHKPDSLAQVAFEPPAPPIYDPLEPLAY
ncbi:ADP-ribose pyrophosphatase YjhB (NUDIX family) [Primorskyibacter sedentarius]|uniref:ADP-ribose pyrophosphatase YjhB (NUDIX family) n=1 Tax=Primorskyibacter sedentarius TaxID=745311 RepID=A0A4R3JMN2_9RHOB|nr:NUDIX domain-containing protein [Primorskyibacter sedentarius]TCS67653.1 ADP-ribose pyrophosphatase YjhB (NUDIX family) [Primorskyibacter sedentarius]